MRTMFVHIPRTGGTFLSRTLAIGHGYDATFSVDLGNITLEHFIEHGHAIANAYRFVTGHVPFQFLKTYANDFDLIFSLVRDPLDRAISMFGYKNPGLEQLDNTDLTRAFETFVSAYYFNNIATRNEQCGYLGLKNTLDSVVSVLRDHPRFMLTHFDRLSETTGALLAYLDMPVAFALEHNESKLDKLRIIPHLRMEFYAAFLSWFDGDYMLDNLVRRLGPMNAGAILS